MEQKKKISSEEIDIKGYIKELLKYKYLFLISFLLFLGMAYIYIRYTKKVYSVSSSILVRDKNQKVGAENLIEGLELFSSGKNLENEIGILSSYSLIKKAIKDLDFDVSYFAEGQVRTMEMYKNPPFIVVLDTIHNQITHNKFLVQILSDSTFQLKLAAQNFQAYIPFSEWKSPKIIPHFIHDKVYKFGDTCKTDFFSFAVKKNDQQILEYRKESKNLIFFVINELDDLSLKYKSELNIATINKKASILKLSLEGSVYEKNIDFLNKLLSVYLQNSLEEKNLIAKNTINFIDEQLNIVSQSLFNAEEQLENFRDKNKVINLDITTASTIDQLTKLDNEKAILLIKDKYYKYLYSYVKSNEDLSNIIAPSAMGINDALLISLINELNQLFSEKAGLGFGAEGKNPSVNIINLKIQNAKKTLLENLKVINNSSFMAIEDINARIAKLNNQLQSLPKTERDLVNIQRKFNLNDHIYNYLMEKRSEAGIAKAANIPDHKIVDYAKLDSVYPISPKKNVILVLCIIAAIILPIILISIIAIFNDTIQSKEQLLNLTEIPILGLIGHSKNKNEIPIIENPKSAISESFRSLRVNLQYLNIKNPSKVIGITSTISEEGKTFCAFNIAVAISITGSKTILVGADMRKPRLGEELSLEKSIGLSSFLINQNSIEEIIQKTKIDNLDIITSGPIPPNPTELLGNKKCDELFTYLQKNYEYIIVDSPPIGLVADYLIIKNYMDSNLYIVRSNYTRIKGIESINELYDQKELKNLFIVLNDVKNAFGYGYGYGYGYYEEKNQKSFLERIQNKILNTAKKA